MGEPRGCANGHDRSRLDAERYRWPDPNRLATEWNYFFDGKPPANPRQYDILSCGLVSWVIRIRGDQLIAGHFGGTDWSADPARFFVKSLNPLKEARIE